MKSKKYFVFLVAIIMVICTACGSSSSGGSSNTETNDVISKYPFFSEMKDVKSIEMVFRGEAAVDLSFVDMFLNMDPDKINEGSDPFASDGDGDTGRQSHVIMCLNENGESLYHFQYYPDYDDRLEMMVIKKIDLEDESETMYVTITDNELIQFLKKYEEKVGYHEDESEIDISVVDNWQTEDGLFVYEMWENGDLGVESQSGIDENCSWTQDGNKISFHFSDTADITYIYDKEQDRLICEDDESWFLVRSDR